MSKNTKQSLKALCVVLVWVVCMWASILLLSGCARPDWDYGVSDSIDQVEGVHAEFRKKMIEDNIARRNQLRALDEAHAKEQIKDGTFSEENLVKVLKNKDEDQAERFEMYEDARRDETASKQLYRIGNQARRLGESGTNLMNAFGVQTKKQEAGASK